MILFSFQLLKALNLIQFSLIVFLLHINKHLGKLYQSWHHFFFFLHTPLDFNVKTTLCFSTYQFSSVQFSSPRSHVQLFETPWTSAYQASLSFTNSQNLLKLMSIESVMPSNDLNLCRPLLLLPSTFPSLRIFSNVSVFHIRWLKYWSFSISPSKEYSLLISIGIDWIDLLVVQGTLKSLLQHHSSKASIFLVLRLLYSPTLTSIHD